MPGAAGRCMGMAARHGQNPAYYSVHHIAPLGEVSDNRSLRMDFNYSSHSNIDKLKVAQVKKKT
jgi:hypothetical protein